MCAWLRLTTRDERRAYARYTLGTRGDIAQLAERFNGIEEVTGSNPVISTNPQMPLPLTRIGPYAIFPIETGRFKLDGGAMFGVVPKTLWEKRIPADERNRITLAMRCLLLVGDAKVILIDAGIGDKSDAKFAEIFGIDHEHSTLEGSLAQVGYAPEDVTDVILTHLHFDHCGGATRRDGERIVATFPNATYHVQSEHWEWAMQPNVRERASFLKENFEPLATDATARLNLLDGGGEFAEGIELIVVNGHTRAMQLVKVFDDQSVLLFAADLVPTAAHVPLPWVMAYDVEPLRTIEEKERILGEAADKGWLLFLEHDPTRGTTRVARDGTTFSASSG
jgi:glyoxylase-like metal-dependent hydrolase (beta-lactamase superfamily II)